MKLHSMNTVMKLCGKIINDNKSDKKCGSAGRIIRIMIRCEQWCFVIVTVGLMVFLHKFMVVANFCVFLNFMFLVDGSTVVNRSVVYI